MISTGTCGVRRGGFCVRRVGRGREDREDRVDLLVLVLGWGAGRGMVVSVPVDPMALADVAVLVVRVGQIAR